MAEFDPTSADFLQDPYPVYAALRADAPVGQIGGLGVYYLSRHADVLDALKAPTRFSSEGMRALATGQTGVVGVATEEREGDLSQSMIVRDPPEHGRLRRIVNRGFTPRHIAKLEGRIREIASELFDAALDRGSELDFMHDIAKPLPVRIIAEILGVDPSGHRKFKEWADICVSGATGPEQPVSAETAAAAMTSLRNLLRESISARRAKPGDDTLSALLAGGATDENLTDPETLSFALLLLIAGMETTTNLLGNAVRALLAHPDVHRRVVADPALVPALTEETLRWDGPVQAVFRQVTEETKVGGTTLPPGSLCMLLLASANRDERVFDQPEAFDLERSNAGHVAFGYGVHFCLGASLARLEARCALETLFERCTEIEAAYSEVELLGSLIVRGPKALPIRVQRR